MPNSPAKPPRKAPSDDMLKVVDPLGEIQRTAQRLHKEAGFPSGVDWRDYWGVAEDLLTAGLSGNEPSDRSRGAASTPTVSLEITELAAQKSDIPLAILAAALHMTLDEHEALCLGRMLHDTAIVAADGGAKYGPFPLEQVAGYLAQLAHEYDASFLQQQMASRYQEVALAKRQSYWLAKLEVQRKQDEPLTHADQNTMHRLASQLRKCDRVRDLVQGAL